MIDSTASHPLIEAVRELLPTIRAAADEIERAGRLPDAIIEGLRQAGIFRMYVPREYGGEAVDPITALTALEDLATADASTAWVATITSGSAAFLLSALGARGADEIFGRQRDVIVAGAVQPRGQAVLADGGYRLTGRWAYGSACLHADWLIASSLLVVNGEPLLDNAGTPVQRMFVFRAADATVFPTWDPQGLRGTGSHDYAVTDLFVPERRAFSSSNKARPRDPFHSFPTTHLLAHPATCLGVARTALETFRELARHKRQRPGTPTYAEQDFFQARFAEISALYASGRAYHHEQARALWTELCAGREPSSELQAHVRLSTLQATLNAVKTVEQLCELAGGDAVHRGRRLERLTRDIHTAASHAHTTTQQYVPAGRMLLHHEERARSATATRNESKNECRPRQQAHDMERPPAPAIVGARSPAPADTPGSLRNYGSAGC
jgi:indole-3-acetate monooxygenase